MVNPDSWRFQLRKFSKEKTECNEIPLQEMIRIIEINGIVVNNIQGFNWIQLSFSWSNSIFINVFSFIGRFLKLGKWHAQSPWLMVSVKKK